MIRTIPAPVAFAALATAVLLAVPAAAQSPTTKKSALPRMADGHPDLQGIWNYGTVTPMERPKELADKPVLTADEARAFEEKTVRERNADLNRNTEARRTVNGTAETPDVALAYNDFWWDRGTKMVGTLRTSLVVDPPDGRIPAHTEDARRRLAARAALAERPAEAPEDRPLSERCILRGNAGPPMTPAGYNNNFQLVQTPGYVVILNEQIHDARIVPMDGRGHVPTSVRQWMGDSRGHWEGDTLVVETSNFNDQIEFQGASEQMRLIERFSRGDADTLSYEFTVTDPRSFAKPWTAQIPMTRSRDQMFEYACHEGNYGMSGTLTGARAVEKAAGTARKGSN
jgi:hypothetical protein